MSGIAILKPDHMGDLVLASPAIRAIGAAKPGTTVFVASKNLRLARFLFPGLEIRTSDLPHLTRGERSSAMPDLGGFDAVAVLRADHVLNRDWAALRTRCAILPDESDGDHQTLIDYSVAYGLSGAYDIDALFYGERAEAVAAKAAAPARRIGISLGSGFHANGWPLTRWVALIRDLLDGVDDAVLLGGPAEASRAEFIVDRLGSPSRLRSLVGQLDPVEVVQACEGLDLVIASDGGTAHLCSLASPILSLFGPSPFRRYAPFGPFNMVLTRDLSCSPCCQYTAHLANGCFTNECLGRIDLRHVERAMSLRPAATSRPLAFDIEADVRLYVGTSHLDRNAKLAAFHAMMGDAVVPG